MFPPIRPNPTIPTCIAILRVSLMSAARPAGPQPRDGLHRALQFISAARPAGPQPRDGLHRALPAPCALCLDGLAELGQSTFHVGPEMHAQRAAAALAQHL